MASKKGHIPAQFLKHPPRSWKGEMRKIKAEARTDNRGKSMSKSKDGRKKSRERAIHVVPDLLAAGAVAVPLIYPLPNGDSVLESFQDMSVYGGPVGAAQHAIGVLTENITYYGKPMVVLGVASLLVKEGAKKLGFNRIGTKRWKIA